MRHASIRLALCCALLIGLAVAPATQAATGEEGGTGKLLLVLDSSGSMKERIGGTTKIAAAKEALSRVVAELPDAAEVGMRVYGAEVFEGRGACQDSQNVVPVGPLDRAALTAQIRSYRPYGETPIGYALQEAAKDLGSEGTRSILLVSDGEATCAPDPCRVAADIAADGIDVKIDVVGLRVGGTAERQLRCIARAGGGDYVDASDADSLAAGLTKTSVRAFRPFAVSGIPVTGTETPFDAPTLDDGQYVDDVRGEGTSRYYLIPKDPTDTVRVAVTARRVLDQDLVDAMNMRLETPDGEYCASQSATGIDPLGFTGILTNGVTFQPDADDPEDPCTAADTLVLNLMRGLEVGSFGGDTPLRAEIVVLREPAVRDVESLPASVAEPDPFARTAQAEPPGTPVVGGVSFTDAAELRSGTYRDTIRDGELLVYKIPVDWGQSMAFTARLMPDPSVREVTGVIGMAARVRLYSPDRQEITNLAADQPTSGGLWNGDRVLTLGSYTVPVKYRNREAAATGTQAAARAGYYYATVELAEEDDPVVADLVLSTDVTGEVTGVPSYVDEVASPAPTSSPSAEEKPTAGAGEAPPANEADEGLGIMAYVIAGAVVVATAVALAVVARSRRRPDESTGSHPLT